MPDEPTPGPGSSQPPFPTFREDAERVGEPSERSVATEGGAATPGRDTPPPDRASAGSTSPDAAPPGGAAPSARPGSPAPEVGSSPSDGPPEPARPAPDDLPPPAGLPERGPTLAPPTRPGEGPAEEGPAKIVPPRADPSTQSEEPSPPVAEAVAEAVTDAVSKAARHVKEALAPPKTRARKVHRVVRHVEPWSVLKLSVLFYAALFGIICVASALLWGAARGSGTVDNVESFITSVGGFGNCEPIDGETPAPTTTTTTPPGAVTTPVDQIDPTGGDEPAAEEGSGEILDPGDDEDCPDGEELVGEFKFDDVRIFQAFVLGGIVLVLAGSAANVVVALLFNLMSDLTGGLRVTVLEEETPAKPPAGSPKARRRG